jgi:hypothetical protein
MPRPKPIRVEHRPKVGGNPNGVVYEWRLSAGSNEEIKLTESQMRQLIEVFYKQDPTQRSHCLIGDAISWRAEA